MHGPNINLIGKYSPNKITLDKINKAVRSKARKHGHNLVIFHFLEASKFIRQIQRRRNNIDAIIFNPGALCNNCYTIVELLKIIKIPLIEIHIEPVPDSKNNFNISVLQGIAKQRIFDQTIPAYLKAIEALDNICNPQKSF